MRDLALQAAGVLAILVAIGHGAVAELRVFARARIEPQRTRDLLRMVWQASTVDWIGIGFLLIAAPRFGSETARHWVIAVAVVVYAYAAIGNAFVNRGPHFGWVVLSGAIALALLGF
jgi:hypothetical protein